MLKSVTKLKRPRLTNIFVLLFSLKVLLPIFVPQLRFGVLRSLAFLIENVLGHSVKRFLFEITKLAVDISKHRTKPPSIFSRGIRYFLTEVLGSADILLEETVPYLTVFAVPSLVVTLGIVLCLRKGFKVKKAGIHLFRSMILMRGIIVTLLTPIITAGGIWLCVKGQLPIFYVFTVAVALTALGAVFYHTSLYRISENMLKGLHGAPVSVPRKALLSASVISITVGLLEPVRLLADFDRYGTEAILSLICCAAYIVFGVLLIKKSRK